MWQLERERERLVLAREGCSFSGIGQRALVITSVDDISGNNIGDDEQEAKIKQICANESIKFAL